MSEMNCNEDQPALKRIGTRVECNDIVIALFRVHSNVYAIQDKCPHLGEQDFTKVEVMVPLRYHKDS